MTDTQPVSQDQTDVIDQFHAERARYGVRSEPLPPRDRSQLPGNLPGYFGLEPGVRDRAVAEFVSLPEPERVTQLRQVTQRLNAVSKDLEGRHYQYRYAEAGDFTSDENRTAFLREYRNRSHEVEVEAEQTYRDTIRTIIAAEELARQTAQARQQTAGLSANELRDASAQRVFFQEDAATLPLRELADRVRSAVVTSDYVSLWLWTRQVPNRITQASATNSMTDAGRVAFPASPEELSTLRQALREAEAKLASRPKPAAPRSVLDAELVSAQRAAVKVAQIMHDRPGVSKVGKTVNGLDKVPW